jgi:dimethylhistidine N-methyltransferase
MNASSPLLSRHLPLRFVQAPPTRATDDSLAQAVLAGLSARPRTLPCRFFYDDAGSALFEQICELPEYYPTRVERGILERFADDMIDAAARGRPLTLVELGSGSSVKTRLLIEAALRGQSSLHYIPIDISGDFLRESAGSLLTDHACLAITAIAAEYEEALRLLPPSDGHPRLFLFLGSNVGNFCTGDATTLLTSIRAQMASVDRLLVGVDLVKDQAILEAAYNDRQGVTAAFNKNLLVRINREVGADFDIDLWDHLAPFQTQASRIEMWLFSRCNQTVSIPSLHADFAFHTGDGIHTENSHKYTPAGFRELCAFAGLEVEDVWTDPDHWFASFLVRPADGARR